VRFYRSSSLNTYLLAPISSNEIPDPDYSMLYRSSGQQSGRTSLNNSYSHSWDTYGIAGLLTEIQPSDSADYNGIWVGRVSDAGEFWGDANLTVDFANGHVNGLLDNPIPTSGTSSLLFGDIEIIGGVLDGEIIGAAEVDIDLGAATYTFSGPVQGYVYGPSAEEVGGVFDTSALGSQTFTGAYIAKQ